MPAITNKPNFTENTPGKYKIEYFRGIDISNQPSNVDRRRGCNGLNMIRDVPGKVRKRTGFFKHRQYAGRINGAFAFRDKLIVHSGEYLWLDGETPALLYGPVNDVLSDAKQLAGKLWFLDGRELLCYDGEEVKKASDGAFVPTVAISKDHTGPGVTYQPVNMLSKWRMDSFVGTAGSAASLRVYQLSYSGISPGDPVTAEKLDADGAWVDAPIANVDHATGKVTFAENPGAPPVTGEDNVRIKYAVVNEGYASRVNNCRFAVCYGANGGADRLFISGNGDFKNYDFYSQLNDPTYFGDLWYGVLGQSHSPIMGYSIVFDRLAAYKKNDDDERNIILRYGTLIEEEGGSGMSLTSSLGVRFAVTGVIQGAGLVSSHSAGYAKEPVFLTREGICAVAPYEYVAERYVQNRSAYLNMRLKLENLEEAYACVYDDFYMLAVGNKIYILDTLETSYEKENKTTQYDAYLWDGVPARVLFNFERKLFFGDGEGRIFQFFEEPESAGSYMDFAEKGVYGSGEAIKARWDFDFSGDDFYKKKRIRYIAVKLAAHVRTSVEIFARVKGEWRALITGLGGVARYFSYENLMYSMFSYSGNVNPRAIGRKVKIRKADSVRFSLRNEAPMEPFGIYEIALEFTESGQYKGN